MKTLLSFMSVTLLLAGLSSCRSYDYYTAGLNKTNMSRYRSFAWLPPQSNKNSDLSATADLKVKNAAITSLSSKGLQMKANNPDLLVTYTATVGDGSKTVYSPTYYGTGFGPRFGYGFGFGFGWGYGWGYRPYYGFGSPYVYYGGETAVGKEKYKEGTVIIDLIDSKTHKIVWRGFGVGEAHKNVQKDIEDLPKVVDGIISQLQLTPSARS